MLTQEPAKMAALPKMQDGISHISLEFWEVLSHLGYMT